MPELSADIPDHDPDRVGKPPTSDPAAATAWMSWLRVMSIAAVVTIHTVGGNAVAPNARETLTGQLAILLDLGGIFAVPVFVMLSGATMLDPARHSAPWPFIRKRLARLLPAIIFWHLWYFAIRVIVLDQDLPLSKALQQTMNGHLYAALYFFWIVLGLSVIAPVLIPFVRENGRRGALIAGVAASLMTTLTMSTYAFREATVVFADTAWTWWIPYLGFFLLGYGLRRVVLRGLGLSAAVVGTIAFGFLITWQWRNPDAPTWLQEGAPVSYYGIGVLVYSCLVYLSFQGLIQPDGPLRLLTGPRAIRLGRLLGDATLGVYALHLTVLLILRRGGWIGGEDPSSSGEAMLLRILFVLVVTYAIVLTLRRVPFIRRVL